MTLELFVEFAAGAGNKDAARNVALTVLYPLYDAGRLAALGAVGALGGIHHFLAVRRLGDLGHCQSLLMSGFARPPKGRWQCGEWKIRDGTPNDLVPNRKY